MLLMAPQARAQIYQRRCRGLFEATHEEQIMGKLPIFMGSLAQ